MFETICGQLVTARDRTDDPMFVTCKRCAKKLEKQRTNLQHVVVEALVESEGSGLFDIESGLPVLTAQTYKRRSCTCGTCDVCRYFAAIERERFIAPWRESKGAKREKTWRWPNINAALSWYADTCDDGFHVGSLGEALARLGRIGATIQTSGKGDPQAIRDADDRVAVEKALKAAACGEPVVQHTVSLKILFDSSVGRRVADKRNRILREPVTDEMLAAAHEMSAQAVGKLVKRMKRRTRDSLREWGLIQ